MKDKYYEEIKNNLINDEIYSKVKDFVPNPILIKNKNNVNVVTEKALHQLILENYDDYDLFNSVKYVKTNHVSQISCYGILFDTDNGVIYYSGDIADLDSVFDLINNDLVIDKIYVDATSNESSDCHVFIGDLDKLIPSNLKSKVYCMHVNNNKCIDMAKEYGFNVV